MDSKFLLYLGLWKSSCGNCCFTLHAWDGIPKSSCHGPGWKHPCLRAAWGWNSLMVWRGVLEVCHLVPVTITDTLLYASCLSLRSSFAAWTDVAGKSCTPARVTSLLFLFQPCFAAGWSSPSACAKQQTQSQILDRLEVGNGETLWGVHAQGMYQGLCLAALPHEDSGKLLLFCPCHCHTGKKMGGDNYCSSPSLLTRAGQGDGTCHS